MTWVRFERVTNTPQSEEYFKKQSKAAGNESGQGVEAGEEAKGVD